MWNRPNPKIWRRNKGMKQWVVSRGVLMLVATLLLLMIYVGIQWYRFQHSAFTQGVLFYDEQVQPDFMGDVPMNICYYVDKQEYTVPLYEYYKHGNVVVTVRYNVSKPEKGEIYTWVRYWLVPALWLSVPLMLVGAALLTIFKPKEKLQIVFDRKNKI